MFTLLDRNKYEDNSNVCKYTRGVLAGMFLSLLIGIVLPVIVALITVLVLELPISLLAYWITEISFVGFFSTILTEILSMSIFLWFLASVVGIVFASIHYGTIATHKIKTSYTNTVADEANTLSIITKYIENKHNKVCTLVNFTKD